VLNLGRYERQAYLNVSGLQRHYRDEAALCQRIIEAVKDASGLSASVGLADGKFPSFAATAGLGPSRSEIVPSGSETGFLAPLPASLLPLDPEIVERLQILGLAQIGDVAALTLPELQSQFGFEGKRLWQLAQGIDQQPLRPRARGASLSAGMDFEAAVAGIDVLIAVAKQLLSRLRPLLRGRAI
jgi:nucleotidyltransferase/DNA polymerase involved in DNA repair